MQAGDLPAELPVLHLSRSFSCSKSSILLEALSGNALLLRLCSWSLLKTLSVRPTTSSRRLEFSATTDFTRDSRSLHLVLPSSMVLFSSFV